MTTSRARKTVFLQQDEEELLTLAAWAVLRAGMPQAVGCWGSSLMPCVFFLQSQQVTQSWVILKSTNNKTAGHTCAAQPHDTGSVRGLWWESSVTYSACWRARLCRHTCLTLTSRKPVAGSTLLSLISIIREDVRGEPALISLSKAPCQLGNLCTGLWCTTQRISCDWAFALPTVSSDFSAAKNHMLLRQCVSSPESAVRQVLFLKLLLWREELQASCRSMYAPLPLHTLRYLAQQFLCVICFWEKGILFCLSCIWSFRFQSMAL